MKTYIRIGTFFISFIVLTEIGNLFIFSPYSELSIFLPATGLGIAILIITDIRKWQVYLIAIFIAAAAVSLSNKVSVSFSLIWSLINTAQVFTSAFLIRGIVGTELSLTRIKDFIVMILIGTFIVPFLFAIISAFIEVNWLGAPSYWISLLSWGCGNGLGVLVITPFVIAWFQNPLPYYGFRYWLEESSILLLVAIFSQWVFWVNYVNVDFRLDMEMFFFIFPLVFWTALRFGFRGVTAASLVLNFIAIYHTAHGTGPFAILGAMPLEKILHLEAFLSFLTLSPLGIAMALGERSKGKQQLQDIIDNSPILFFAKNLDGKYIFINRKYEQFFNIPDEQIIGKTDQEILPKEFADSFNSNDKLVLEKNKPLTYEKQIQESRGIRTFIITKFPLRSGNGITYAICSIVTDITEYKQSEERFKLVVESAPNAIILLDRQRKIVMINAQTEKVFGYKREELVDKKIELLVPQRFLNTYLDLVKNYFDNPITDPLYPEREFSGLRKDGTEVPVEVSICPINTGENAMLLVSIVDITLRKKADENLRLSEKRFNYVLAATQDAIYDRDFETGKIWRNEQYEKVFDGPSELIESKDSSNPNLDWWKLQLHPDEVIDVTARLDTTFKKKEELWNQEYRFKRKDGSYAYVIDRGFIIYNPGGTPIRMIGALMDLTERKKSEDEIRKSEERFHMFEELSYEAIAIHENGIIIEINPPLEKMFGYQESELTEKNISQLIASESIDSVRKKILENIEIAYEAKLLRKDRSTFYGEIQEKPLYYKGKNMRVIAIRDITDRKEEEETRKHKIVEIFERQVELLELSSLNINLSLPEKLKKIIESDAKTIKVERVSIWFFNEEQTSITADYIYLLSKNEFIKGFTFQKKEYPRYFQELLTNKIIDANDAQNDPRTSELSQEYLIPLGITSLMIVPVKLKGNVVGIINHGSIGIKRKWSYEEQTFIVSIADIITIALENNERVKIESELKKLNELFEQRVKERTAELAENEKKFRILIETAADAIISTNSLGRITFWNQAAEKMFDYPYKEAIEKDLSIIISPKDFLRYKTAFDQYIGTGMAEPIEKGLIEVMGLQKGGKEFPIEITLQSRKEGDAISFTAIIRDITARKKMEEEWDTFFKKSIDLICIMEIQGTLKRINLAFEKIFGFTEQELIFKPFLDFIHPDDKPATLAEIEKLSKGIPSVSFVSRCKTKEGIYKSLEWNAIAIENSIYAIARDITARKAPEEPLEKQVAEV